MRYFIYILLLTAFTARAENCFDHAGQDYHIDPDLLRAIAFRESSMNSHAMNIVTPEKYAVGEMQIHSQNFPHLSQFGITPQKIYADGCMNIYTGAYYLALAFHRWGMTWDAVGAYNAGFAKTPEQPDVISMRGKYTGSIRGLKTQNRFSTDRDNTNLSIYAHEAEQILFTPARKSKKNAAFFYRDKVKKQIVYMWVSLFYSGRPSGAAGRWKVFYFHRGGRGIKCVPLNAVCILPAGQKKYQGDNLPPRVAYSIPDNTSCIFDCKP